MAACPASTSPFLSKLSSMEPQQPSRPSPSLAACVEAGFARTVNRYLSAWPSSSPAIQPALVPADDFLVPPGPSASTDCPLCRESFSTNDQLRSHMFTEHPNAYGSSSFLDPLRPLLSTPSSGRPAMPYNIASPFVAKGTTFPVNAWMPMTPASLRDASFPQAARSVPGSGSVNPFVKIPLLFCEVCSVRCDTILQLERHLEGQKHQRKLQIHRVFTEASKAFEKYGIKEIAPDEWMCVHCNTTVQGKTPVLQHFESVKHRKRVKAAAGNDMKSDTTANETKSGIADNEPESGIANNKPKSRTITSGQEDGAAVNERGSKATGDERNSVNVRNEVKNSSTRDGEKIVTAASERKNESTGDEPDGGTVSNELESRATCSEQKVGIAANEREIEVAGDDPKIGTTGDEMKSDTAGDEMKSGTAVSEPKSGIVVDAAKSEVAGHEPESGTAGSESNSGTTDGESKSGTTGVGKKNGTGGSCLESKTASGELKNGSTGSEPMSATAGTRLTNTTSGKDPRNRTTGNDWKATSDGKSRTRIRPPTPVATPPRPVGNGDAVLESNIVKDGEVGISVNGAGRNGEGMPPRQNPAASTVVVGDKHPSCGLLSVLEAAEAKPDPSGSTSQVLPHSLPSEAPVDDKNTPPTTDRHHSPASSMSIASPSQPPSGNESIWNMNSDMMSTPNPVVKIPTHKNVRRKHRVQSKPAVNFSCALCSVSCNSDESLNAHLRSAKHKRKEVLQAVVQSVNSAARSQDEIIADGVLRCEVCNVSCCGLESFQSHLRGKLHAKRVRLGGSQAVSS